MEELVNLQDAWGQTPLWWAAQRCHVAAVRGLLRHGADPLIVDNQGTSALHVATISAAQAALLLSDRPRPRCRRRHR
jgi:ankyrin repeat protein